MKKFRLYDISNNFYDILDEHLSDFDDNRCEAESFYSNIISRNTPDEIELQIWKNTQIINTTKKSKVDVIQILNMTEDIDLFKDLDFLYNNFKKILTPDEIESFDVLCNTYNNCFDESFIIEAIEKWDYKNLLPDGSRITTFIYYLKKSNNFWSAIQFTLSKNNIDILNEPLFKFDNNLENVIIYFKNYLKKLLIKWNYIETPFNWLEN